MSNETNNTNENVNDAGESLEFMPETTSELVAEFEHLSAEAGELEIKERIDIEEDAAAIDMVVAANDAAAKVNFSTARTSHKAWMPILIPLLNELKEVWDDGENATENVNQIVFRIGQKSAAFNALQNASDAGQLANLRHGEIEALKRMRGNFIDGMNRMCEAHLIGEDDPRIRFKQDRRADINGGKSFLTWFNNKNDPAEYDYSSADKRLKELAEIIAGWGNSASRPISKEDIIDLMGLYQRDENGEIIRDKNKVKQPLPMKALKENVVFTAFYEKRLMLTNAARKSRNG